MVVIKIWVSDLHPYRADLDLDTGFEIFADPYSRFQIFADPDPYCTQGWINSKYPDQNTDPDPGT